MTTARTFNDQRDDVDAALMAALGFANTAADSFERGGPYLVRGAADLVPTTKLLDDYRGMIFCTHPQLSRRRAAGRTTRWAATVTRWRASGTCSSGAGNPYIYPDNLPRINAQRRARGASGLLAEGHPRSVARRRIW